MLEVDLTSFNALSEISPSSPLHILVEHNKDYTENQNTPQDGEDKPPDIGSLGVTCYTISVHGYINTHRDSTQVNHSHQSNSPRLSR